VIAVLSDADVAWHRVTLPRAPASRMRAALVGLLEEALLDDAEQVHLALPPDAQAGQPAWIAAAHKRWLAGELAALERADVMVDRVVPSTWPDEPATGHFAEGDADEPGDVSLTWAALSGVVTLRLKGTLARSLLPEDAISTARWSATPAVASPAERWLGAPVVVMTPRERALLAARSLWNLRQFDLAGTARGARALSNLWRRVRSPEWRLVRFGLAALVLVQIIGLNAWALRQHAAIESKREAMTAVLQTTFPQVRAVLDAPLQMQREVDSLRAAAGRAGESDLETLLGAAAAAWPEGRGPAEALQFEGGRLSLSAGGWSDGEIDSFRSALGSQGWQLQVRDGRMSLSRTSGTAS
jgi:general secretion pathway protein L